MTFSPRRLNYEQVRQEAERFLDQYHVGRGIPVPIEVIVEFDLSMTVIPVDGLKLELKVDAFLTNDLEQIFVDEWIMLHAPSRFRFSLAHEVGHYWLHDPLYQQSTIQCLADWRQVQDAIGEEAYSWFEWQANSFAGLVLVPGEPLKKAFRDRVVALQHAGIRPEQVHHQPTRQYLIQNLADEFKLSEPTMEIRLEKDGLLAPVTNPHHA